MKRKLILVLSIVFFIGVLAVYFGNDMFIRFENDMPSQSIGTTADGSVVNGKRLPSSGENFTAYSYLGTLLGRNCVHSSVRDIVLETYSEMHKRFPATVLVYGETGWCGGGRIRPHKTHRNGMSVDFMVPTLNSADQSVPLPSSFLNKFGYSHEFDASGKIDGYRIDFEAMAAHLFYLQQVATQHSTSIEVVIFDPNLQPLLLQTEYGEKIRNLLRFSTLPSWIRHDEHYHVDFASANPHWLAKPGDQHQVP